MYDTYCRLRNEKGVKDADVAKATGISQSMFSEWKHGKYTPKIDKLQKIADYFGVSVDYLATGNDTSLDSQLYRLARYAVMLKNIEKLDEKRRNEVDRFVWWMLHQQEEEANGKGD